MKHTYDLKLSRRHELIKSSQAINRVNKLKLSDVSGTVSVPFTRPTYVTASPSPSPSHITVDGHSTSLSWCQAPSGAHDQILLCHRSDCYGPLSRGAPHLTRGRVCHLSEVCLCPLYSYTCTARRSGVDYCKECVTQ
jgi:hypothetical protein